jgi:hypothetical protein
VVSVVNREVQEDAVVSVVFNSRRGVGGEIPLPSFFRPRTFRSEATAFIDNRGEGCHTVWPTGPERSPMNMQYWGPVLIAPDRGAPSRDTRCKHSYEKFSTERLFGDVYLAITSSSANSNGTPLRNRVRSIRLQCTRGKSLYDNQSLS